MSEIASGSVDVSPGSEAERPIRTEPFTVEDVRAAFQGTIPPARLPASYRFWTLVVACVMVALPLIYVALVAMVAFVMVWHATTNHVVFQNTRNAKGAVFAYFGPLVVLGVVLFFLAKPLFAKRVEPFRGRSIRRDEEPALFELVDGVCKAVGAPRPIRIDVDCNVNASAGPERGLISLLRRRLVLTIGMPLVAVFNADQFAGVLAHEFGHFAQSAGMRLTYVIRSVNAWFARVVYERDSWDEELQSWSTSGAFSTIILANFARLLVWLSRRILWVLMYVGHAVSCTMSRQMEFDADRCEAFLGGSATSATTTKRLRIAGWAQRGAMSDLTENWKEGRLPDDLPRLIEANIPQLPKLAVESIDAMIDGEKTGVFDTHPADKDRIAAVLRLNAPGIFHLEGPATAIFRDFDALSRDATIVHYKGLLGDAFDPASLQPYREIVRNIEGRLADNQALGRVFAGATSFQNPLSLPATVTAVEAPEHLRDELERLRRNQAEVAVELEQQVDPETEGLNRRVKLDAAVKLLSAGYRIKPAAYGLSSATLDAAQSTLADVDRAIEDQARIYDRCNDLASQRTVAALGLLERDDAAEAIEGGARLRDEARGLLPIASALSMKVWPEFRQTVQARAVLLAILGNYEGNERNEKLHTAILEGGANLHQRISALRDSIGEELAYPFEHARQGISLVDFVVPTTPDPDDLGELLNAGELASDRISSIYFRILSRLAAIVEQVETHLGLPPLALGEESGHNHA